MKSLSILILLFLINQVVFAQIDEERNAYFRNYYWNNSDSIFNRTSSPEKWQNESAVIIAKSVDYSVNKKAAGRLIETYGVHKRVKLLDQNAIDEYSEFSFGSNKKYYAGFFSSAKIEYYIGAKVIKADGKEVVIGNSDAIKKEMSSGTQSFSYNNVAIPDLQIGDIIDFYYCYEKKFPSGSFHSFSPMFYEMNEEYPILNQRLRIDVLRYCYLNAKSINGAPELAEIPMSGESGINRFELNVTDCKPYKEEEWVKVAEEIPLLKFQTYFLSNNGMTIDPFEDFYGPVQKRKDVINTKSLIPITHRFQRNVVSGYHYFNGVYKATFRYLKMLKANGITDDKELIKEAYLFLREYWYQQAFLTAPQNVFTLQYDLSNMLMTSIISAALLKVKCDHEVIYFASKDYTRMDDLLFMEELGMGIKTMGDNGVIITMIGPHNLPNEISEEFIGVEAYSILASRKEEKMSRFIIPGSPFFNEVKVKSELNFRPDADTLSIKSTFTIGGECKAQWDSIVYVSRLIKDEFDYHKYKEFIHEGISFSGTKAQMRKKEQMRLSQAGEENERMDKLSEKLCDYFQCVDIKVDTFKLVQSGRWLDNPEMIFEVQYKMPNLIQKIGRRNLFSIGQLIGQHGLLQDEERQFNINFPFKRKIEHQIVINYPETYVLDGLSAMDNKFETEDLSFSVQTDNLPGMLKIKTIENIMNNYLGVEKWPEIRAYYEAINSFNEKKIRF